MEKTIGGTRTPGSSQDKDAGTRGPGKGRDDLAQGTGIEEEQESSKLDETSEEKSEEGSEQAGSTN